MQTPIYEIMKTEHSDISFNFIKRQFNHKANCMQSIELISTWEEFRSICL